MTESFGARLRRQRERRCITLAQITSSTKIKASLFEGLERDDVSKWPAGIFRRSFVRAYAQAIGLNPDEVCREFLERFPERDAEGGARPPAEPPEFARVTRTPPKASSITAAEPAGRTDDAESEAAGLRLMLADQGLALIQPAVERPGLPWRAVAFDLGLVLVLAISTFIVFDAFWMPLALSSVLYYVVSTLLGGRTPGAAIFSPPARSHEPPRPATSSLDMALERRAELTEVNAASFRPIVPAEPADAIGLALDDEAAEEEGAPATRARRGHARGPITAIDIESRRARA